MTADAIAGVAMSHEQSVASQQASSSMAHTTKLPEISAGNTVSRSSEAVSELLSNIHSGVQRYANGANAGDGASKPDAVSEAKENLLPSPYVLHPAKSGAAESATKGDGAEKMVGVLSKSFDHAMFLALVNQVVGGLSHTTTSLIRQA